MHTKELLVLLEDDFVTTITISYDITYTIILLLLLIIFRFIIINVMLPN